MASTEHPNYLGVSVWLVVLLVVSLGVVYLPFSHTVTVSMIFIAALAKAVIVAANYMHLKFEQGLIRAVAVTPVLLFIILTLGLVPDIVYNR